MIFFLLDKFLNGQIFVKKSEKFLTAISQQKKSYFLWEVKENVEIFFYDMCNWFKLCVPRSIILAIVFNRNRLFGSRKIPPSRHRMWREMQQSPNIMRARQTVRPWFNHEFLLLMNN